MRILVDMGPLLVQIRTIRRTSPERRLTWARLPFRNLFKSRSRPPTNEATE